MDEFTPSGRTASVRAMPRNVQLAPTPIHVRVAIGAARYPDVPSGTL